MPTFSDNDDSFNCACNTGYNGDGTACTADNECPDNSKNCEANATCCNTERAFTCTCNSCHSGDGVDCADDDECTATTDNSVFNAACTETDYSLAPVMAATPEMNLSCGKGTMRHAPTSMNSASSHYLTPCDN